MKHRFLFPILVAINLSLCTLHGTAQNISRFEYFGSEDGLSQNSVYSIMCDANGFLWAGTMNGFNRFDGKNFKVFTHTMSKDRSVDGEPVVNGRIERIWADSNDFVWLETYDGHYRFFNQRTEKFGMLPSDSGESSNEATAFLQYSEDIVAVGTANSGITILKYNILTSEYDSYDVTMLDNDGHSVHVRNLLSDKDGNLWISTRNGIYRLTRTQIDNLDLMPMQYLHGENMTSAICQTTQNILFGTKNHGIIRWDCKNQLFSFVTSDVMGVNKGIKHLVYKKNLGTFCATTDAHLFFISNAGKTTEMTYHGTEHDEVDQLYVDAFNQVWVTTVQKGATRIDPISGSKEFYQFTPDDMVEVVDQERPFFFEDSRKSLWIGLHGGGLIRYNRNKNKFDVWRSDITDSRSIASNVVHCIAEDKLHNIWIGTGPYLGGLTRIVEEKDAFQNILPWEDCRNHTDNVVRSLMTDAAGHIWVGTKGCDIYIYDNKGNKLEHTRMLRCSDGTIESSMPYCMTLASDNRLWIGTKGRGIFVSSKPINLSKPDIANITFEHICRATVSSLGTASALSHDYIYSIVEDRHKQIWAASYGAGLYRIKGKNASARIEVYSKENSLLLSDKVRFIKSDHDGGIWIGSVGGVNYVAPQFLKDPLPRMRQYTYNADEPSICYNDVCYIYQSSDSAIYFATMGGGLCRMDIKPEGNIYTKYTVMDGLSNNSVYGMAQDSNGDIWISTENGLCRLDKKSNAFESFNVNSGLAFNSFSEASVANTTDGALVFGGYQGFSIVRPQDLDLLPKQESLMLTDLRINNVEQTVGEGKPLTTSITYANSIKLEHWQSNITVSYTALNLTDPKSVRYSYMLVGLDNDWNYVGNTDRAVYTNLLPGQYTLRVRHMAATGYWNDNVRELSIIVLPPWWLRWWSIVIYIIVAVCAIFFSANVWKRFKGYREALTIEKKLNALKLNFFTNIAHEIRTPLTLIISPIDTMMSQDLPDAVKQQMITMRRSANRLLKLVSQLLEFRKLQEGKVNLKIVETDAGEFVRTSADAFTLVARQRGIQYDYSIQPQMQKIWIDIDEMDTVIYNLLSNAFKFTDKGKDITVSVEQDDNFTYIRVADQGIGIADTSPEVLFKRYTVLSSNNMSGTGIGLSLSYELVALHKGTLSAESEVGRGTTFCIRLRNGKSHFVGDRHATITNETTDIESKSNGDISDETLLDNSSDILSASTAECPNDAPSVLVVEDNTDIQRYVENSLSSRYKVRKASNGKEALKLIEQKQPDIIITDIMMPIMDGTELISRVRGDFSTSHIPIIALSAKSNVDSQIETYNLGVDAYLTKPFNMAHVIAVVDALLRRRHDYVSQLMGIPVSSTSVLPSNPASNASYNQATEEQRETETASLNSKEDTTLYTSVSQQTAQGGQYNNIELSIVIPAKDEEFMRSVIAYAEQNYKKSLSVESFAEHFNMSRTVFYNKVKSLTGKGPLDFVRQIKFKIAADMLRKGYNVSEAAFQVGYADVKYFSKLFKQIYGYNPSQEKSASGKTDEQKPEEQ